jgi:hypothetical protein
MTNTGGKVNINSKELLAKLMSTENIQIRHKKINTAAFDGKNRILYLPIWKDMNSDLYTMFITHEVGHALFTEQKAMEEAIEREPKLGFILNLVEDARIDKKMKVRFPGVKIPYIEGTKQLQEMDFFTLKKSGIPVNDYRLLDRINLHYKLAIYDHIPPIAFSESEQEIINEIDQVITYQDVIRVSEKLLKHIRDEKQKQQQEDSEGNEEDSDKKGNKKSKKGKKSKSGDKSNQEQSDEDGDSEGGDSDQSEDGDEDMTPNSWDDPYGDDEEDEEEDKPKKKSKSSKSKGEEDAEDSESSEPSDQSEDEDEAEGSSQTSGSQDDPEDFISKTMQSAIQNMNKLNDKNATEIIYCNFPKINPRSFIVPYKEVQKQLRQHYGSTNQLDTARGEYNKFKAANQKIVDYLVKEFELKKAAAITSRTKTSSTGVLDTRKIHSYKFNDDLFKRIAEVPQGKNHGLVIFVDCSGSMSSNMLGTLQQLINLASFCRKVGIPYDVYGFTDNMQGHGTYQNTFRQDKISVKQHQQEYKNEDVMLNRFNLRQYFSSRMKSVEHQEALVNMTALVNSYRGRSGYVPQCESLGGTPFDEAIMTATALVKDMKTKYNLDMVHTIFLTDGYGTSSINYKDVNGHASSAYGSDSVVIRTGKREYDLKNYNGDTNRMFLEILKKETDSNVVGFYICEGYQVQSAISRMTNDSRKISKLTKDFERDGYLAMQEAGWDEYYVVPNGNDIQVDVEGFQTLNNVSNKDVQKEFSEIFKRQQKSRVILRKFIDKIAKKKELTKK